MGSVFSNRWLLAVVVVMLAACSSPEERIEEFLSEADELYSQGEYAKADISYRNVLQINANHVPALHGIAKIAEQQGDLQKAYGLYSRLVEVAPEYVEGRVTLGKIYLSVGQLDMALEQSQAASQLAPSGSASR